MHTISAMKPISFASNLNVAQRLSDNTLSLLANIEKEMGNLEVCISGKIFHPLLPMPFDRVIHPKIASYLVRICSRNIRILKQRLGGKRQFSNHDVLEAVKKIESVCLKTRGLPLKLENPYRGLKMALVALLSLELVLDHLFTKLYLDGITLRAQIARYTTPTEAP